MTRALAAVLVVALLVALAAVFVSFRTPTPEAIERAELHRQIDSLGQELDAARGAFNAMFARLGDDELACVRRHRRAPSIR